MEFYLSVIIRTVMFYILIIFIFRLMGKREIGELSILDLVVFMMIAELAVVAIENPKDPVLHSIVPMVVLMGIQIGLALLSLRSEKIRRMIGGKAAIIINHGKIDEHEMRKQRYNFDDLLVQLRDKDINKISEVEFAILEPSGKMSIIKKDSAKKVQDDLDLPLIIDGRVHKDNLRTLGKSERWLLDKLASLGHHSLERLSFVSFSSGEFYIDIKDEK
ncbi:DUF421 domain-containing protein [Bacillus lacus]|uniref:DUF421 domain-containing protein n=1 Tax=Metabacillus lacus TaxID=1983721 RepID=A0A7X2LY44_9BACI|nr:DUF421 domain-containing protein [Metabacillus lacus]MRX71393.1 DUF421 domain-containing protein [Metabacillus lacus]